MEKEIYKDQFDYIYDKYSKLIKMLSEQKVKCSCGGYFNDWHSHASDCFVINNRRGKIYPVKK